MSKSLRKMLNVVFIGRNFIAFILCSFNKKKIVRVFYFVCLTFSCMFAAVILQFRMKARPSPLAAPPSPAQPGPSSPPPPSYESVMSRRESQPTTPTTPSSKFDQSPFSSDTDYTDSAPLSPLDADGVTNPFDRDGIGRQSMSEKRGRAALDAKQSTFFVNRERLKEDKGLFITNLLQTFSVSVFFFLRASSSPWNRRYRYE